MAHEPADPNRSPAPVEIPTAEEDLIRLLLIDDEPSVVNALRRSLRREGYRIFTATSPEEGLRLVGQERVDIVISDHLMPEMTGIDLFTLISRLHGHVRRIVLTGQADVDMAIRAINEGHVHRFLTKPWDDEELRHLLRESAREIIIQRRHQAVQREAAQRTMMPAPKPTSIRRDARGAIVIDEARALMEAGAHPSEARTADATPAARAHDRRIPALADLLLQAVKDLCLADHASILERQPDGTLAFAFVDVPCDDGEGRPAPLDPSDLSAAGRVMTTGIPEIVDRLSATEAALTAPDATGCLLVAPLIDDAGVIVGVVEAVRSRVGGFQEEHVAALWAIATPLANAVRALGAVGREPQALADFYHAVVEVMRAQGADLKDRNALLLHSRHAFELERARRYGEERMSGLARLARGVAHEVNNPLSVVQSNVNTAAALARDLQGLLSRLLPARAGSDGAEVVELLQELEAIETEAREGIARIARIVGRLAAFGELDAERVEEVHLGEEAARVADLLCLHGETAPTVPIELHIDEVPALLANKARVRQVLIEVMENALRAAEQSAAPRGPLVVVRVFSDALHVSATVSDNGPGIPPEHQTRIFDPFFTTKAKWQSTGLGLTAAYGIVRALGGTIAVDSVVDRGTSMSISLPWTTQTQEPAPRRVRGDRYYEDLT